MIKSSHKEVTEVLSRIVDNTYAFHYSIDEFGYSIYMMEKEGRCFLRMSWANETDTSIYLDCLSVNESCRRYGNASFMLELAEWISRQLGADEVGLMVKSDTWLHEWYKRRGCADTKVNEIDETYMEMKKELQDGEY